jgi:hypothetical protein
MDALGSPGEPSFQLTCFYRDAEEKTRRASFLRMMAAQCFLNGAGSVEEKAFLKSLNGRIVHELNAYTLPEGGGERPLPEPNEVRRILTACLRANLAQYPDLDLRRLRPLLRPFAETFRAFRRAEKCAQAGSWQGLPDGAPDPNPVLLRYLADIEPIMERLREAYGSAMVPDGPPAMHPATDPAEADWDAGEEGIDDADEAGGAGQGGSPCLHRRFASRLKVHVNIALQPKGARSGPVHGKTGTTEPSALKNPQPAVAGLARVVRVDIRLPDEPDEISAFLLPYTVAHEVGIHSLQQVSGSRKLYPDNEKWHFSEGFMDAAIFDLVHSFMDGPPNDFNARSRLVAAQHRHRTRWSEDLPSIVKGKEAEWVDHLGAGSQAWKAIKELARAANVARRIDEDPGLWALCVAFKLNVLDLHSDMRAELLDAIRYDWGNRPRNVDWRHLLKEPDVDATPGLQEILFTSLHDIRHMDDLAYCRDLAVVMIERYRAMICP